MRFVIEIHLGNEAMTHSEDVATALRDVANRVEDMYTDMPWSIRVRDINGNTVGSATLQED
jgi:hypothetical protein